MLRKLLDWICPRIEPGHQLPYGFSRGPEGWHKMQRQTEKIRLLLPLWYWHGVGYEINHDWMRKGWWLQMFCIGVLKTFNGFDIQFRTGYHKRGDGLIKPYYDPPENETWIKESEYFKQLSSS